MVLARNSTRGYDIFFKTALGLKPSCCFKKNIIATRAVSSTNNIFYGDIRWL